MAARTPKAQTPKAQTPKAQTPKAQTRKPGRGRRPAACLAAPLSEQAEQAIIEATLDLFAEQGFEGVCVEAVAARAGVGKATIYRRWPNKEELLLAALGSMKSPIPELEGVRVRDDLVAMDDCDVRGQVRPEEGAPVRPAARRGREVPAADGQVQGDRGGAQARGPACHRPPGHRQTGELRADTDVEIARLALMGTILAKEKSADGELNGDFAAHVVDELLLGLAAR